MGKEKGQSHHYALLRPTLCHPPPFWSMLRTCFLTLFFSEKQPPPTRRAIPLLGTRRSGLPEVPAKALLKAQWPLSTPGFQSVPSSLLSLSHTPANRPPAHSGPCRCSNPRALAIAQACASTPPASPRLTPPPRRALETAATAVACRAPGPTGVPGAPPHRR